jgi:hypothetical protein
MTERELGTAIAVLAAWQQADAGEREATEAEILYRWPNARTWPIFEEVCAFRMLANREALRF